MFFKRVLCFIQEITLLRHYFKFVIDDCSLLVDGAFLSVVRVGLEREWRKPRLVALSTLAVGIALRSAQLGHAIHTHKSVIRIYAVHASWELSFILFVFIFCLADYLNFGRGLDEESTSQSVLFQ